MIEVLKLVYRIIEENEELKRIYQNTQLMYYKIIFEFKQIYARTNRAILPGKLGTP